MIVTGGTFHVTFWKFDGSRHLIAQRGVYAPDVVPAKAYLCAARLRSTDAGDESKTRIVLGSKSGAFYVWRSTECTEGARASSRSKRYAEHRGG